MKKLCLKNSCFIFIAAGISFAAIFWSAPAQSFIEQPSAKSVEEVLPKNYIWEKVGSGINEPEITAIDTVLGQMPIIYVGTSKAVYRSVDGGKSCSLVLYIKGSKQRVNDIHISNKEKSSIYVASDAGVFVSDSEGKQWKKIFSAEISKNQRCFSVLDTDKTIYVATTTGLFFRSKTGFIWRRMSGELGSNPVFFLQKDDAFIYAAAQKDIFQFDIENKNIIKIFSVSSSASDIEILEGFDEEDGLALTKEILSLYIFNPQDSIIFVATRRGIFYRTGEQDAWNNIPASGFSPEYLTSLVAVGANQLVAATQKGIFYFKDNQWKQLYKGLQSNNMNCLAFSLSGDIYAGSDKGFFVLEEQDEGQDTSLTDYGKVREFFDNEPSIKKVQNMAIEYAEVSPNKVKQWRQQAKRKAWLPDLSIGLDGDRNLTSSDSTWGSYSSGGQQYVGSDDKTFYNNLGWDVSLSWDLGDIIWNSDQTSIDSRSKLVVELREDILDEVTRLYFERRRIQVELLTRNEQDYQLLVDKQMRVEELTALIDALTGGRFSEEIRVTN